MRVIDTDTPFYRIWYFLGYSFTAKIEVSSSLRGKKELCNTHAEILQII